jgi:hypothetical protein
MRKPIALAIIAIALGAAAGAQAFTVGTLAGVVIERGPNHARLAPYSGVSLRRDFALSAGAVEAQADFRAGALVGTVLSLRAGAAYRSPAIGPWIPAAGLGIEADFGDALFMAETLAPAPPATMGYAFLRLEPLRFRSGDWEFSLLSADAGMGFERFGHTWRVAADILRVERRLGR